MTVYAKPNSVDLTPMAIYTIFTLILKDNIL